MDDTTEQKLLAKLDNVKCTPKFSQATALGARRSLRAMLGCKAKGASLKLRASIATFEFRNRRRAKQSFVAVEGLDKRGVRDLRRVKPKAKQTRANRPCTAEKGNMETDTSVQRNGSSEECARDAVFNVPGDAAPNSVPAQYSATVVDMGQKRKGVDDEGGAQVHKRIFIQPSETIPRTMRQRGITSEPNEMEYVQGECDMGQTGGLNDTSAIELQTRKRVITQPTETIPRKMRQRGDENKPKEMEYVQGGRDMDRTGGMFENFVVNATSAIEHDMLGTSATELNEQGGILQRNGRMEIGVLKQARFFQEGWTKP